MWWSECLIFDLILDFLMNEEVGFFKYFLVINGINLMIMMIYFFIIFDEFINIYFFD